ncbi:MAG: amino acid ABC transporter permease [Clostridia bacterium]|nr:amino acid ABC transporter permease [Lachnospiraceae bacterium]NCC01361.1 amino acid ABC transporter permease [Clostridia bacterium]
MVEGLFNPDRWEKAFESMDTFGEGMLMTLKVMIVGLIVALVLGVIFGVLSTTKIKALQVISRIYVEFFQNTPLVVQVFFYYNGLPIILKTLLGASRPVRLSKLLLGVCGVGLYHGAYIAEVIRTGLEAVPKGQYEAAHSQGFTSLQAMRYIVLPQTLKIIMPPLANQALNLVKNTSVLALVAGGDLMYHADNYVSNSGHLQGYIICCVLYFIICFPLATLARKLEENAKKTPQPKKKKKMEVA